MIAIKGFRYAALATALMSSLAQATAAPANWSDPSPHTRGFLTVNGIGLEYLDWGGRGPALIFIHGSGDNAHAFDDLAPAFTDYFHVLAYSRRGHGGSVARPPYDTATLTEDLRAFMDALGIAKAHLAGWSLGGNEITAMAAMHPDRVGRIVYLDGGYDWADPDYKTAFEAIPPSLLDTPPSAMASFDAYVSFEKAVDYTRLDDMRRIEAYLRESVVIEPDGSVKPRIRKDVMDAVLTALWTNPPRDYARVKSPALAIYAQSMIDLNIADARRRDDAYVWERTYMAPFRTKSIARVRRELANVHIMTVAGAHDSFFLTSREQVVKAMRRFLNGTSP
ncbi:MAG TPA: alpha/beta hydrolase [Steroidobacteraceae bacterium]|nr:alpha/beta hydrolase [Steroidobacteraceae bacterium]